jgi:hypothetical protein
VTTQHTQQRGIFNLAHVGGALAPRHTLRVSSSVSSEVVGFALTPSRKQGDGRTNYDQQLSSVRLSGWLRHYLGLGGTCTCTNKYF